MTRSTRRSLAETSRTPASRPGGNHRWAGVGVATRDAGRAELRLHLLDADKTGYPDYYEELVPRLLAGGLLLIDNVLVRGRVTDPQNEQKRIIDTLNDRLTADEHVDSVMVLVADGLTFARRR